MNASDRPNTCKSRGIRYQLADTLATGARVSNAYPTFRTLRDSLSKERLIPDSMVRLHDNTIKDLLVNDGDAFH